MEYPYMISNNKIEPILEKIKTAAKPAKFTHEFLKKLGFNSSNDRAIIPLFKRLGFLNENGDPTEFYDRLKDSTDHQFVLGERIRELYHDLFAINTEMQNASDEEIKGAFSRVSGESAKSVQRYFATFKVLSQLARFDAAPTKRGPEPSPEPITEREKPSIGSRDMQFHYNIQIHLPATNDISVYNAIFRSLKENLLIG